MASFKAKFPVLQELFAKNHRGAFGPSPAGRGLKLIFGYPIHIPHNQLVFFKAKMLFHKLSTWKPLGDNLYISS